MTVNRVQHSRLPSLYVRLVAIIAAICVVMVSLEAWNMWQARAVAINADTVETANLARSLAQHAHDLVQAVDVVLFDIRERAEVDGISPDRLQRLHQRMVQDIVTVPMIHGVFLYNAAGDWVVNSVSTAVPSLNNSDREYFRYHRSHPDDGVHIGLPVRSKSDGGWIVTVSRRVDAADGAFDGVVLATVSINALRDFYATFKTGRAGAITLASADGIIIARESPNEALIGADLSRSFVFAALLPQAPVGDFQALYAVDQIMRLGSYRRVAGYPLVTIVAHGLDDVLVEWRKDMRLHVAITGAMILTLAVLGIRFARQMKRTQKADRRYRLLADNASDAIICVGLNGERLYISPAFAALTGWSVREGLERTWDSFVHPDDRDSILTIRDQLRAGAASATGRFRFACKNSSHRWAEARVQGLNAGNGEPAQFVATIRDITERKMAEDQVAGLNQELAIQATTDVLTGLSNRRQFDEVLDQEWRRAAREERCLSLLMIDVDRFKLYNDRYGHQRGDDCLRAVANAMDRFGRRAGDIVARYGGEEFVTLLPGADAAAAAAIAEAMRAAIEAIGFEHAGNPPTGMVTASLGVATATPVPKDIAIGPAELLAAADAALYVAKHAGRNRVAIQTIPVLPLPTATPVH